MCIRKMTALSRIHTTDRVKLHWDQINYVNCRVISQSPCMIKQYVVESYILLMKFYAILSANLHKICHYLHDFT